MVGKFRQGFGALAVLLMGGGASVAQDQSWQDKALKAIAADEPSVVEAMFTGPSSFWASMRDDGSRRDGFAEYLCLVLHDQGMPNGDFVVIHIWDAAMMSRGEMREIGSFECQLR